MQPAALRPACPQHRPAKRRRTATSVLAGDFEPSRPRRDYFSDMANSHIQPCHNAAALPHGSPIVWDLRDARRSAARTAAAPYQRAPAPKMAASSGVSSQYALHPNSPRLSENLPGFPRTPVLAASGTAPQRPHHPALQSPFSPPAALSSAPHSLWSPAYRSPVMQWAGPLEISTAPRPSLANPNSPPTPSRSISSYTSRTSSKRPRTPDDDELIPGSTPLHPPADQSDAFPIYDPPPSIYSPSILASPFPGAGSRNPSPPKSLAWFSPPSEAAELPPQSPFSLGDRTPPPAHRRHALSVAALLSPSFSACLPHPPPSPSPAASVQPPESRDATPPQSPVPAPAVLQYLDDMDVDMDVHEDEDEDDEPAKQDDAENSPPPPERADDADKPAPAPTPEPDHAKSRASKAMRIIQSEDELTDLEAPALSSKSHAHASLAMTPAPGRVRRKRPAARKGWKGWVEVEVDEEEGAAKGGQKQRGGSVEVPWATLRERRTRSGRQFDA